MNKQPEVTAATRQSIVDAFWKIYENKRIEQIHIKEISDLAGVHRGTFYQYFTDIYALLQAEETALIGEILENAPKLQAADMSEMLGQIAEIYTKDGLRLCLLIGKGGDPDFIHKFKDALFPAFRNLKALPNSDKLSMIFEFGISGLIMAFCSWYRSRDNQPIEDFMETMRSLIERGIPATLEKMSG